jgi:hypothetical protein
MEVYIITTQSEYTFHVLADSRTEAIKVARHQCKKVGEKLNKIVLSK